MTAAVPALSLSFDPEPHRYYLEPGHAELPSVTKLLEDAGIIDWSMVPLDVLKRAGERGTRVHQALHYLEDGELDPSSVLPEETGYLKAAERFMEETGFQSLLVEHMNWHRDFLYAGRVDRIGLMPRKGPGSDKMILDFKTGVHMPGYAIQLALYAGMQPHPREFRRMSLQLKADGRYKPEEYPQSDYLRDFGIGQAAAAMWYWKQKNQPRRVM